MITPMSETGGSVELGENTLEAAKREMLEETCLGGDQVPSIKFP